MLENSICFLMVVVAKAKDYLKRNYVFKRSKFSANWPMELTCLRMNLNSTQAKRNLMAANDAKFVSTK